MGRSSAVATLKPSMRHIKTQRALASLKYRLRTFKHQRCRVVLRATALSGSGTESILSAYDVSQRSRITPCFSCRYHSRNRARHSRTIQTGPILAADLSPSRPGYRRSVRGCFDCGGRKKPAFRRALCVKCSQHLLRLLQLYTPKLRFPSPRVNPLLGLIMGHFGIHTKVSVP
jgi:hypothetical protein